MSNMSITKTSINSIYYNRQPIENHPNPYHNLPLNSFGGSGGSKIKQVPPYTNEENADIAEHHNRIENTESIVENEREQADEVRKSFKSNKSKHSVLEETLEDDEPKKTWGQKFCAIVRCCFQKKEKKNPLLYPSQSCADDENEKEPEVEN
jgi:hypothetical protein